MSKFDGKYNVQAGTVIEGVNSGTIYTVYSVNASAGATKSYFALRQIDLKKVFLKHYEAWHIKDEFLEIQKELYRRLHKIRKIKPVVEKNFEYFVGTYNEQIHHFQVKELLYNPKDLTSVLYPESKNYIKGIEQKLYLIIQLLEIFELIHKQKVIHTDLKPEQIMLQEDIKEKSGYKITIIDFDHAIYQKGSRYKGVSAGTECWLSPEHIKKEQVTYASDSFTLAIIIYIIISGGKKPFDVDTYDEDVLKYKYTPLSSTNPKLNEIYEFFNSVLHEAFNPSEKERVTVSDMLSLIRYKFK
jgi:serine/threonine protein kinase